MLRLRVPSSQKCAGKLYHGTGVFDETLSLQYHTRTEVKVQSRATVLPGATQGHDLSCSSHQLCISKDSVCEWNCGNQGL